MSDPGSLHEAGGVELLEQLLCVDHQACMLQQTSLPRELSREGIFLPAAGALQGHSQGTLTFCYSRSQLSDTVSQLTDCHGAVGLERIQEQNPKSGPNTELPLRAALPQLASRGALFQERYTDTGRNQRNSPPFV